MKINYKLELYGKQTYQLILKNGLKLAVSKSGYKELKEVLGW
jgi:DNA-binding LytR/AlgR family response regulator